MYRPAHTRRFRGLGAASVVDLINQYASQLGVPSSLAVAVAQKESSLNPAAVGSKGEIGLFQLMPATAASLGVDPSDLTQNVQGGVSLLASLYKQFGNWTQALEAYNAGPTAVNSGNVPSSSVSYASSILASAGQQDSSTAADMGTDILMASDLFAPSDLSTSPWVWGTVALAGVGLLWWATA
jgi:hypothetical protein